MSWTVVLRLVFSQVVLHEPESALHTTGTLISSIFDLRRICFGFYDLFQPMVANLHMFSIYGPCLVSTIHWNEYGFEILMHLAYLPGSPVDDTTGYLYIQSQVPLTIWAEIYLSHLRAAPA